MLCSHRQVEKVPENMTTFSDSFLHIFYINMHNASGGLAYYLSEPTLQISVPIGFEMSHDFQCAHHTSILNIKIIHNVKRVKLELRMVSHISFFVTPCEVWAVF